MHQINELLMLAVQSGLRVHQAHGRVLLRYLLDEGRVEPVGLNLPLHKRKSTTFGCTLGQEDKPWPEVFEQMIRERLKPLRPVEVINAGVPGYTLEDNLHRLAKDVLPLKPDTLGSARRGAWGYCGNSHKQSSLLLVPEPPWRST